jgi:hypothetical protein
MIIEHAKELSVVIERARCACLEKASDEKYFDQMPQLRFYLFLFHDLPLRTLRLFSSESPIIFPTTVSGYRAIVSDSTIIA